MPEVSEVVWYILTTFIAILLAVVSWYTTTTLKQISENQQRLSDKLDDLTADFYRLKGEHNAIHKMRGGPVSVQT